MTDSPLDQSRSEILRVGLLRESYDQALDVAGDVWPTPALALAHLLQRGVSHLSSGELRPIEGNAPHDLLASLHEARDELLTLEASYMLIRYLAYCLTRDASTLEATWVTLADQHLDDRARIVEARRREEHLKRELLRYGEQLVTLPEHGELPEVAPDRPRKSRGMFAGLFDGAEAAEIALEVPSGVVSAADRVARDRGWTAEWGDDARLLVLTHGISLALREREADAIDGDDEGSVRSAFSDARRRTMQLEGRYATLRLRFFELRHNQRILGWRVTALQIEAQGMRRRLDVFAEDRERLEALLEARRAEGPPPPEHDAAAPRLTGWRGLMDRLFSSR